MSYMGKVNTIYIMGLSTSRVSAARWLARLPVGGASSSDFGLEAWRHGADGQTGARSGHIDTSRT